MAIEAGRVVRLEVDGKTYLLDEVVVQAGNQCVGSTHDAAIRALATMTPLPCRLTFDGVDYSGRLTCTGWAMPSEVTSLRVEDLTFIPPVEPVAVDWSELRSACHRRDWQAAWEIVGTDHTGAAAPGEVYIFGVARRWRAVTAALRGWYLESLSWSGFGGRDLTWKDRFARIKQVAAWESKVAAQYVSAADRAMRDALRFLDLAGMSEEQAREALFGVVQLASAAAIGLDKAAQIADSSVRALRSGAVLTGTLEITSPGTWFDESEPLIKEAWFNAARPSLLGVPGIISSPFIRSQAEPRAHMSKSERMGRVIFGKQHIIPYTASE